MVRTMKPTVSLNTLRFTSKAAAKGLQEAINTAMANAGQSGLNLDQVYFKSIEVNEGPVMKRFRPGSKGRALPYKKRMSHVKIVLSDEQVQKIGKGVSGKSEEKIIEKLQADENLSTEGLVEVEEEKKGEIKPKAKSKK